jgi:hypothetical protein
MEVMETLDRRSKGKLDFLDYCVHAMQLDPVFVFLAQEYRINPTIPKAVALFHTFCAPAAPAKVSVEPDHEQMQRAMRPITVTWTRMQAALVFGPGNAAPSMPPSPSLFDGLVDKLMGAGVIGKMKRAYQAHAEVTEETTRLQQHFVEKIWRPIIRPHLVSAGFWRIAEVA